MCVISANQIWCLLESSLCCSVVVATRRQLDTYMQSCCDTTMPGVKHDISPLTVAAHLGCPNLQAAEKAGAVSKAATPSRCQERQLTVVTTSFNFMLNICPALRMTLPSSRLYLHVHALLCAAHRPAYTSSVVRMMPHQTSTLVSPQYTLLLPTCLAGAAARHAVVQRRC
jgi:hypothetical protein